MEMVEVVEMAQNDKGLASNMLVLVGVSSNQETEILPRD
jgi:hypothetical protein